ncbi:hypothetical protein FQN51_007412 [Onygenales sp. PD_10]|nr:hypothetical protein FQN51_007412 [Onygenales sp. PD_10]
MASNNTASTPAAPPAESEPPKQNFRLDNDSSATLTLPDGRKLGYAQYGSLTGRPIFYLHGLPGSRLEAAALDQLGLELGARVISVDRPGIGWSSPQPDRKLLDHPRDIGHLADHLGLDCYSVMGISGGGPPALACAAALPREKLKCVSIIVGLGPPDIGMSGAGLVHRVGFPYGFRYAPLSLVRWFWKFEGSGRVDLSEERRLELMLQRPVANEKDGDFMKSGWPRLSVRATGETFAQGFEGVWLDGRLACVDFGFRVEDIRPDLPVHLWYGKQDVMVPPNHGVQIAARLGGDKVQLRVEDETHASMVVNKMREILEALVRST